MDIDQVLARLLLDCGSEEMNNLTAKFHMLITKLSTENATLKAELLSAEILAARDQRVAEACARCSECLPIGCGLEGKTISEAIRSGKWRKYI